jgi:hypothetical protein
MMIAVGAGALVVLALGLLVFGIMKGGGSKVSVANAGPHNATKFVPQTGSAGGKTSLNLTFTDGTSADVLYDPTADLAALGVNPLDSGKLNNFGRAGAQFQIDHGAADFLAVESPTPAPLSVQGPNSSPVPVIPAASPFQPGRFLTFKYGDWRVGVWEGFGDDLMTQDDDATWAAHMSGSVTSSGFLVLTATAPLKLTPYGTDGGPAMLFGDLNTTGMLLTPGNCSPLVGNNVNPNAAGVPVRISQNSANHYEGDICLKNAKMEALVEGSQTFVRSVTDSLEIQNLKLGPARS